MAVIETAVLLTSKNELGEKRLIYPITQADCVDGLEELVNERVDTKSVSWNDLADRPFGDNADGTVKQLGNEYLPIFDHRAAIQTEILSETSVEFTGGEGGPSDIAVLNNNEIYYVVWDGTEYVLTAHSVVFNGVDGIAVGNTSIIGAGDDTGEPFVLGYAPEHNLNVFVTQSPEDSTHTVRIYQSTEETFTLKDEYRPDVPHFNLAEMGLGDPTEDENVSMAFITTDTTEIFAAFEKGPVKFTITLDGSVQSHVMTGRHYISDNVWMAESVYNNDKVLYLAFVGDGIMCRCFSSDSVLPDVGNSDNGKVLTVVGANWSAQELPAELPEVTAEDNGKVLSVADGAWSAQDAPTSLPSVTAEDEGKVLTVKDGVWTVTEAPAGDGGEPDILPEGEFQFTPNDDTGTLYAEAGELMGANVLLVDGKTYQVVWDGSEYTCLASTQSFGTATGIALGNLGLLGIGDTTDEPFIIGAVESGAAMCYTSSTETSHTIRIYQRKSISWNDLTDRPFVDGQHIYIETSNVSFDTTVDTGDMMLVHVTDTIVTKGSLIGATVTAYFPDGNSQSAVITEADILIEYDGGIALMMLGAVLVWICFRSGEHTATVDGELMTLDVPKAGIYIAEYVVTELSAMEFLCQPKYLDAKYLPMDAIETYLDNKGKLITVDHGSSGIWNYSKWSNGTVDMWGTYEVYDQECTNALGSMFRTHVFQPDNFPFTVNNPQLVASYETSGYGAMLWATTETSVSGPPSYYLIRPVSGTIASGKIIFHVTGTWV